MYLTWSTLILMILAAGIVWFWQDSLRVRDLANDAAMEACARMGLQFLDGTVAFSHLRLVRDRGTLRMRRTYTFDYTANSIGRLQGFAVLLGLYVESVGFASTPGASPASPVYPPTPQYPPSNQYPPSSHSYGNDTHGNGPNSRPTLTLVESGDEPGPVPPATNARNESNPTDASPVDANKVFDLDEWRKKHQRRH